MVAPKQINQEPLTRRHAKCWLYFEFITRNNTVPKSVDSYGHSYKNDVRFGWSFLFRDRNSLYSLWLFFQLARIANSEFLRE